jgi:aminopeptidase N
MNFRDPHSYTAIEQGQIKHIDLKFEVNFGTHELEVEATYSMNGAIGDSLFLDSRDVKIKRIHSGGRDLPWEFDREDPILGQRLHIHNFQGATIFTIEATTSSQASALQWLNPEQTTGGEHPYLYSQCQAIHARSIFPCQDSPVIRFTYSAEVSAPSPLVAMLAGSTVGSKKENEKIRYQIEMPQPIPAYLFAIAVGNIRFSPIGDRCGVYAEPEIIDAAAWEFGKTEDILIEAEKLFGPYVWDRYDILILPPSFPYGGMENARLTFLNPMYIVGDRSETIIVTHELGHAWTGNLVTNATWEDFWLNEGWTTYAQYRITEELEGREYAQFRTALARDYMFEDIEQVGWDSPQSQLHFAMEGLHPDEVISTIPYQKGNAFLVSLEEAVGRERFDEFIQSYISEYQFRSLTTAEFEEYLGTHLPEVFDLVDIKKWLYQPGFPEDAPSLKSTVLNNLLALVDDFKAQKRILEEQVFGWKPAEVTLFLRSIPQTITVEECRYLEALFDLKQTKNAGILSAFFVIALQSGYRETLPRVERFLQEIGRTFLLLRVYRAMLHSEWTRNEVTRIFDNSKKRYHPITVSTIEQVIADAGL